MMAELSHDGRKRRQQQLQIHSKDRSMGSTSSLVQKGHMTTTTPAEEIQTAIIALKASVRDAISTSVQTFQQKTGLSPSDITINMVEVTTLSDSLKQYVVGNVDVTFDL